MRQTTAIPNYIIRRALPADIPAVRAMQEHSMWVLGSDFYEAGEIAGFLTEFGTMDDAVVHEGHYFVAEGHRGAILGSGGWTRKRAGYADALGTGRHTEDGPSVRSVFVDPAATRRGIASAIMGRVEQDAIEHGVPALHLTATLSGVPLYARLGYLTEEFTELVLRDDSRFGCVRMAKQLARSQEVAA